MRRASGCSRSYAIEGLDHVEAALSLEVCADEEQVKRLGYGSCVGGVGTGKPGDRTSSFAGSAPQRRLTSRAHSEKT